MGATNQIKGTNITLKLREINCCNCSQKFTEEDIQEENFDLWFDTTNDVKLPTMAEVVKEANYYFPNRIAGYQLTIWIRSIEHQNCPEISN